MFIESIGTVTHTCLPCSAHFPSQIFFVCFFSHSGSHFSVSQSNTGLTWRGNLWFTHWPAHNITLTSFSVILGCVILMPYFYYICQWLFFLTSVKNGVPDPSPDIFKHCSKALCGCQTNDLSALRSLLTCLGIGRERGRGTQNCRHLCSGTKEEHFLHCLITNIFSFSCRFYCDWVLGWPCCLCHFYVLRTDPVDKDRCTTPRVSTTVLHNRRPTHSALL